MWFYMKYMETITVTEYFLHITVHKVLTSGI